MERIVLLLALQVTTIVMEDTSNCGYKENIMLINKETFYQAKEITITSWINLDKFKTYQGKIVNLIEQFEEGLQPGPLKRGKKTPLHDILVQKTNEGDDKPVFYQASTDLSTTTQIIEYCNAWNLQDLTIGNANLNDEDFQHIMDTTCKGKEFAGHLNLYNKCIPLVGNGLTYPTPEACYRIQNVTAKAEIDLKRKCGFYVLGQYGPWHLGKRGSRTMWTKMLTKVLTDVGTVTKVDRQNTYEQYWINSMTLPMLVTPKAYPYDLTGELRCLSLTGLPDPSLSRKRRRADNANSEEGSGVNEVTTLSTTTVKAEATTIPPVRELTLDTKCITTTEGKRKVICIDPRSTARLPKNHKLRYEQAVNDLKIQTGNLLHTFEDFSKTLLHLTKYNESQQSSEQFMAEIPLEWLDLQFMLEGLTAPTVILPPSLEKLEKLTRLVETVAGEVQIGQVTGQNYNLMGLHRLIGGEKSGLGDILHIEDKYRIYPFRQGTGSKYQVRLRLMVAYEGLKYQLYQILPVNRNGYVPTPQYFIEYKRKGEQATYDTYPLENKFCTEIGATAEMKKICHLQVTDFISIGNQLCAEGLLLSEDYRGVCPTKKSPVPTYFKQFCHARRDVMVSPTYITVQEQCEILPGESEAHQLKLHPGTYRYNTTCQLRTMEGKVFYSGGALPQRKGEMTLSYENQVKGYLHQYQYYLIGALTAFILINILLLIRRRLRDCNPRQLIQQQATLIRGYICCCIPIWNRVEAIYSGFRTRRRYSFTTQDHHRQRARDNHYQEELEVEACSLKDHTGNEVGTQEPPKLEGQLDTPGERVQSTQSQFNNKK